MRCRFMRCRFGPSWIVVFVGVFFISGCGHQQRPELPACVPVSGRVLIDGQPAIRAVVSFHSQTPQADGKIYSGQTFTDDEGRFRMTTFTAGDGVPPGEYTVTIVAAWISKNGQDVGVPDLLKGRYATPEKSLLKVQVEAEPLELETFDLKSK